MTISEKILAFFLSIEASLFQLWLKRFSAGVKADFVHYHSDCGEFFFFKKNGWPGEVSRGGLNYTPNGDTILTVFIKRQETVKVDELVQKFDAQLSDEPDFGKTVLIPPPVFESKKVGVSSLQQPVSSVLNRVMDDLPLFKEGGSVSKTVPEMVGGIVNCFKAPEEVQLEKSPHAIAREEEAMDEAFFELKEMPQKK